MKENIVWWVEIMLAGEVNMAFRKKRHKSKDGKLWVEGSQLCLKFILFAMPKKKGKGNKRKGKEKKKKVPG